MKRGLRLFGHPVHPMLVHIPMGLLLVAPLWDLLDVLGFRGGWGAIGRWTVGVGCLGALAAATAGLVDFAAIPAGHPANRAANFHLYTMLGALCVFGASLLARQGFHAQRTPAWLLALDAGGALMLAAGGYFGGQMVYRHGIGHELNATDPGAGGYHPDRNR